MVLNFSIFSFSIFQNHLKDNTSYCKRKLSKFISQNIIVLFIFSFSIFQNHLEDDTPYCKRKLSKFSSQNIIVRRYICKVMNSFS